MMKYIIAILLGLPTLMSVNSCKTKEVIVDKGEIRRYEVVEVESLKTYFERNVNVSQTQENTHQELIEALSSLNINYNGDHLEDKLDVLLSKTNEGTKLSFTGKGSVGYQESINTEISNLRNDFFKYTDSIHSDSKMEQQRNFEVFIEEWKTKQKEVHTKTLTPMVWLLIGLALIVGMFLSWISKKIKPLIKWL